MRRMANFINGEFVAPRAGQYLPSVNPATEAIIFEIPRSDATDVAAAVESARKAFKGWSERRAEDRADVLDAIADGIEARIDELALMESEDQGKPASLAKSLDIPRAATNFRFFAGAIRHQLNETAPVDGRTFSYVKREPIGVAGLISPWNLPLYLLTWKIAPAIAYGNTCVAKPSELTSGTAAILCEIMKSAGLPNGVVNIVFGLGAEAGQALVEHPDVPLISFTGGTVTGRRIAATAAPMLKKLSLELGGKNPTLIFKDALNLVSMKELVRGVARSAFLNQGEICLCGSRIYVEKSFFEEFKSAFIEEVKSLRVGLPGDRGTFMGPLVSSEHRDKVESFFQVAREQGVQILCGGARPKELSKGYFVMPTVFEAPSKASKIQQEEIFGPAASLTPFESEEEAVELANSTRYGLSASLWTESLRRAHALASELKAGTVWVNGWMVRDLRMPFGGVKESGLGREGQLDSLHFFTEAKTVCVRY